MLAPISASVGCSGLQMPRHSVKIFPTLHHRLPGLLAAYSCWSSGAREVWPSLCIPTARSLFVPWLLLALTAVTSSLPVLPARPRFPHLHSGHIHTPLNPSMQITFKGFIPPSRPCTTPPCRYPCSFPLLCPSPSASLSLCSLRPRWLCAGFPLAWDRLFSRQATSPSFPPSFPHISHEAPQ